MLPAIRTLSQQLAHQLFAKPHDVVSWFGAIQAQDYSMSKWAVGARLANASISDIENALLKGEILRTHIMRPTWHFVAAEDIRWMLALCKEKLKVQYTTYDKYLGINDKIYHKTNNLIAKMLEGNNHLTRQEIAAELVKAGVIADNSHVTNFMYHAELEGIACSGIDKGNKPTYALIDERVAPTKKLKEDESLALLATKYFRSHSPASLHDFIWWSGLSAAKGKMAINLIATDLYVEKFAETVLYVHKLCNIDTKLANYACLLPSFDEYLISYKNRSAVIDEKYQPKAFTKNGIFRPILMYNGKIIGTWRKQTKKESIKIEISMFEPAMKINKEVLQSAEYQYLSFYNSNNSF